MVAQNIQVGLEEWTMYAFNGLRQTEMVLVHQRWDNIGTQNMCNCVCTNITSQSLKHTGIDRNFHKI